MLKPFLMGFPSSIEGSSFLSSKEAFGSVGDNTGNLAFCFAINRALGGNLSSVLWNANPKDIESHGKIGIITLSNQLGEHSNFGSLTNSFKNIDISMVGIGLGAQSGSNFAIPNVPEGTIDWIRVIQEKAITNYPNIAVRGDFSFKVLEKYNLADKSVVLGCPTLFINPAKNLGKIIHDRYEAGGLSKIAITAGHQRWKHLSKLEASLVKIAQDNHGAYICQSPLEMVQIGRGEAKYMSLEIRNDCRDYIAPWMTDEEFIKWTEFYAYSFFSASAWMEYIRRYDFVIGTRIHGVMLAMQSGIPGLCIAHDSRTIELCETMAIPHVKATEVSQGLTKEDIKKIFQFDYKSFDLNRIEKAKIYVDFLTKNKLNPESYLQTLSANEN